MNRLYFILSCFLAAALLQAPFSAGAQTGYHYIKFNTKKGTPYQLSRPEAYLSERAIQRRKQYKIPVDSTDLPVNPAFTDSLTKAGATLINTSRWMNQALVQTEDPAVLARINAFPFVQSIGKMSARLGEKLLAAQKSTPKIMSETAPLPVAIPSPRIQENNISYGNNYSQVSVHEGEFLHNRGFQGEGMLIAVLDAGFQGYKTNPMFDSLRLQHRVLMEWDFIRNEVSVNEDHSHGMACLSTMAANIPGIMVGSAPHAQYLLFRTENVAQEYPYEEQAWLVAAETADSAGANIISSSLGYIDFDDPAFDHSYAERDGQTSLITRAANMAARKGILVVNSAGNNGALDSELKYISCPGDGTEVFTVGAIQPNKTIADFSSWGPAYNGRVKPDVVSIGQNAVVALTNGNAGYSNGTSFSAPNMAGLLACLWQAYPEFTYKELTEAVRKSSDHYTAPDARYGYGIPNFRTASQLLQQEKEKRNYQQVLGKNNIKAFPVPFYDELKIAFQAYRDGTMTLRLLDLHGRPQESKQVQVQKENYYTIYLHGLGRLPSGVYYIQTDDGSQKNMIPVMKQ